MTFGKAWRLGGFVAALGASGALIASATGVTGAYFTDVHSGTLQATAGHLELTGVSDTNLDFTGLMPGADQQMPISYTTSVTSGNVDVWLVFPQDTAAERKAYAQFTGASGDPSWTDGGLGRYGHFKVSDTNNGLAFQSYNLSFVDPSGTEGTGCTVTANGRGGSNVPNTLTVNSPKCGVPQRILLASNLPDGGGGTITITFGLTGRQTQQGQGEFHPHPVTFEIVGTQHGIAPDPNLNF